MAEADANRPPWEAESRRPSAFERPSAWERRLLGFGLLLAGVLLIDAVIAVWPAVNGPASGERSVPLLFGIVDVDMAPDSALLLLVVVAGGLGSAVNAATEFGYRVGDDRLERNYLWWYSMRFLIGTTLALVLYFVVRGGLFDPSPSVSDDVNPYVFAGLAGLAGLFSAQAVRQLGRLFGAVLGEEPYAQAAPTVQELVRGADDEKGRADEMVLRGHGFVEGCDVVIDQAPQAARLIDDTRIGVRLDPERHREGDEVTVVVRGPGAEDGRSLASEATKLVVPGGQPAPPQTPPQATPSAG